MSLSPSDDECSSPDDCGSIVFDPDGRIVFDGEMDFSFKSFHCSSVGADIFSNMRNDCYEVSRVKEARGDFGLSYGETYWIGCEDEPRCAAEVFAKSIFAYHTKNAVFDRSKSGAEWWAQVINCGDDIGWHWDKDYSLEPQGYNVHPHLGTVTYFSDHGGPTVVVEKKSSVFVGHSLQGEFERCWISRPRIGKHMCFDGRYLHGAPSNVSGIWDESVTSKRQKRVDDCDGDTPKRVSFLVNVWLNNKPAAAERLSDEVVKHLSQEDVGVRLTNGTTFEPLKLTVSREDEECELFQWYFGEVVDDSDGSGSEDEIEEDAEENMEKYSISMMLPVRKLRCIEGSLPGASYEVSYGSGIKGKVEMCSS